jgi:hypothetical protein
VVPSDHPRQVFPLQKVVELADFDFQCHWYFVKREILHCLRIHRVVLGLLRALTSGLIGLDPRQLLKLLQYVLHDILQILSWRPPLVLKGPIFDRAPEMSQMHEEYLPFAYTCMSHIVLPCSLEDLP